MTSNPNLHLNHDAIYRLNKFSCGENNTYFCLTIDYKSDHIDLFLGCNRERAELIYHTMVRGGVTPSTVLDIMEDLEFEYAKGELLLHDSVSLFAEQDDEIQNAETRRLSDFFSISVK